MTYYAFRVEPQKERAVHLALLARGFHSFFAHEVRETRRLRHRRHYSQDVIVPLLTGYALVMHDGSRDWWRRIFRVKAIISVVGVRGEPSPIPERALHHLASISGERYALPCKRQIAAGSHARVTAGPFQGFAGRVEGVAGPSAKVLLMMFGAEREIEIDTAKLEEVGMLVIEYRYRHTPINPAGASLPVYRVKAPSRPHPWPETKQVQAGDFIVKRFEEVK